MAKKNRNRTLILSIIVCLAIISISWLLIELDTDPYFILVSMVFIFSSTALLINNLSDLFVNLKLKTDMNLIAWGGIILSILWWIILESQGKGFWRLV